MGYSDKHPLDAGWEHSATDTVHSVASATPFTWPKSIMADTHFHSTQIKKNQITPFLVTVANFYLVFFRNILDSQDIDVQWFERSQVGNEFCL